MSVIYEHRKRFSDPQGSFVSMDVFKILARSTSLAKGARRSENQQRTPSTGEASNPQIFGNEDADGVGKGIILSKVERRSGKRKRNVEVGEEGAAVPAELDFFGGASNGVKKDTSATKAINWNASGGVDANDGGNSRNSALEEAPERWTENRSKQVLKLHKLKITVVESRREQEGKLLRTKKDKKRKREQDTPDAPAKKKLRMQLYPQPLTSFAHLRSRFGISRRLAENIEAQGYTMPTEVQLGSLPLLLRQYDALSATSDGTDDGAGREKRELAQTVREAVDLLTIAPTGSGKTLAFLIPLIHRLQKERKTKRQDHGQDHGHDQDERDDYNGPRALVIAPTKELSSQIVNEGRKLCQGTGVRISLMRKGMRIVENPEGVDAAPDNDKPDLSEDDIDGNVSKGPQQRQPLVKADILVCTPLTLLNAIKRTDKSVTPLSSVRFLILDEADVLLDPLFRQQTLTLWTACTNPLLGLSLWSATMGSSIEELAKTTINDRWTILSRTLPASPPRPPLLRLVVGLKDSAVPHITHNLTYCATEPGKLMALRNLLHPTAPSSTSTLPALRPPFLVFTQTIPRALALHAELVYDIPPSAGGSSRIACLHADLSDRAREEIMKRFREAEIWVLITTDLLARGVDFRGLNGVVNYDVPGGAAAYVHRVGRTGRAGREGGVAVTLYTNDDLGAVKAIANVIAASERVRGQGSAGSGDRGLREGKGGAGIQKWLLDALPSISKREKKELKRKGVAVRRVGKDGREKGKARISTKSGWEKRRENNRRHGFEVGLRPGSKDEAMMDDESGFEGFD